jgi:hypothetical protein
MREKYWNASKPSNRRGWTSFLKMSRFWKNMA